MDKITNCLRKNLEETEEISKKIKDYLEEYYIVEEGFEKELLKKQIFFLLNYKQTLKEGFEYSLKEKFVKKIIGKNYEEMKKIFKNIKISYSLISIDKNYFITPDDIRMDRIKIKVENNKISEAYVG